MGKKVATVPPTRNLKSLSLSDLADLLSAAGGRPITQAILLEDVAAGAPLNPDGTMDLITYTAWLSREVGDGD